MARALLVKHPEAFAMDNRQQNSKPGMREKQQPVVGRDVPDESKEHHTEIAVEAGRHDEKEKEKAGNKR
jgi:hypothetical protein